MSQHRNDRSKEWCIKSSQDRKDGQVAVFSRFMSLRMVENYVQRRYVAETGKKYLAKP